METREARNARGRGSPARRPSSICSTYAQTLPGTYLPSEPIRLIRPAVRTGTSCPRSRRDERHAIMPAKMPRTAITRDSTIDCQARPVMVSRTDGHWLTVVHTIPSAMATMTRMRSTG